MNINSLSVDVANNLTNNLRVLANSYIESFDGHSQAAVETNPWLKLLNLFINGRISKSCVADSLELHAIPYEIQALSYSETLKSGFPIL